MSARENSALTKKPLTPALLGGWLWLAGLAAVTVIYRATVQSFTIDESFVFQILLNRPAKDLFNQYDAAYHVLHTWACWRALHSFGRSEFVIRLPSVIAGLAYLVAVGALCRRLLGNGWQFVCGVILLSANPLIADYLSISRGYGAALAFFAWGFHALLASRTARAGVLFGLSIACNLTFLFPVAAVGATYLGIQVARRNSLFSAFLRLALPLLAVAAPILVVPLLHAHMSNYFYGSADLDFSVLTLAASSLAYHSADRPHWVDTVTVAVLLPLCLLLLVTAVVAARKRDWDVVLPVGSLALSFAFLVAAHRTFHVLYPWTRTGLYLIWLFLLSCVAVWGWAARERSLAHWLAIPVAIVSIALAVRFLIQFDTRFYYDFHDDADVAPMMRRVRDLRGGGEACIGGSWMFEPTVNYYRYRYRMNWLKPMERSDTPKAGCRYFLLTSADAGFVESLHLRPLLIGPVSHAILAEAIP